MQDKTDQILKASIAVFTKKGYLATTTLEIAKEAKVAEVTLFRKFTSKQNLFKQTVKIHFENRLNDIISITKALSLTEFIKSILHDRFLMISKNRDLVQMLISESLLGNLPEDLDFTKIISWRIKEALTTYFQQHDLLISALPYSEIIVGILLQSVILPQNIEYHLLSSDEQHAIIESYVTLIKT